MNNMPPYGIDSFGKIIDGGQLDTILDAAVIQTVITAGVVAAYEAIPVIVTVIPPIYQSVINAYDEVTSRIMSSTPLQYFADQVLTTQLVGGGANARTVSTVISTPTLGEMASPLVPYSEAFVAGFAQFPPSAHRNIGTFTASQVGDYFFDLIDNH